MLGKHERKDLPIGERSDFLGIFGLRFHRVSSHSFRSNKHQPLVHSSFGHFDRARLAF